MRQRPSRRSQLGQTSVEYLGVIVVVAALVAVLLTAAPGVGRTITCKIEAQISRVGGGSVSGACAETSAQATEPCVIRDASGKIKASLTVASIKGGGEVKIQREYLSDGTVKVTLSGAGDLGLEGKLGAEGSADLGTFKVGTGAELKGSVSGQGETGATWTFASEKQADDFVDVVRNRGRDGLVNTLIPIAGPIITFFAGEDRPIPAPSEIYIQGGPAASGSGEATAGAGYAEAGLDLSSAAGLKLDRKAGTQTLYYQLKGSGTAGVGAIIGAGGETELEGALAITVKDGKAIKAEITGKGSVSGSFDTDLTTGVDPKMLLKEFTGDAGAQSGYRGEVRGTLDLQDPANAAAFQAFIANPATGTTDLAGRFASSGAWDARVYTFGKDELGAGASGGLGLAFGAELGYEGVDSNLKGAWTWSANSGGIQRWADCK